MAASSSTKPFTFDGFAEELANTSTTYKRPADTYNAAKNAPPPPAAIGTMKNSAPRRPPPGFEKKMLESENQMSSSKQPENIEWHSQRPPMSAPQPLMDPNMKAFFTNQSSTGRNVGDKSWQDSKTVGERKTSRNSSGSMKNEAFLPDINLMQNMFTMPGPYGDNAPQGTESPSNPMFGMARSPHSSGGSNASNGTSAQMMQQLMGMISQNPALSHMFTPVNPMMNMMNMNPAMVQAMMNMMVSMNQFQNMANMTGFMQNFQKWANSGQFPPNMEAIINNFGASAAVKNGSSKGGKSHKNSLDNNSSNVNTSSSPTSSMDSETKVKMSPRTQERLTNVYDEINSTHRLVERLQLELEVNGPDLKIPKRARYFIIKSFTEEDVHRAVKYKMWCSTYYGNRRLESAYDNMKKSYGNDGKIMLFFSVNASGHFCGVAEMTSRYDPDAKHAMDVWCRDEHNEGGKNSKWRGMFSIDWVYVKDIPNTEFTHLRVSKNGGKPFPHSRDTQEIEPSVAEQAIKVFHVHKHSTSLLDDFDHYNRMEERQYAKDRAKSYKYLNDNSGNGRRDSGISDDKRRDSRGTGRSHDRQQERPKRDHRDGHRRERTVLDSLITEEAGPSSPIGRPGAARNLEYERDAMPSPERHGNMFEDLPGVLSKLKPDSVTKILAANGPKNQNNGGKYVPVDEQINSSQNIDKIPRKVPGQPGPNAIPIVKPKDHDSNRSGSENSTPEKKPVPRTRVESDTVEPVTSETTEKEETTVDSQSVITVEDTTKKPDGSIPEE